MKKVILIGMVALTLGGVVANAATSANFVFKKKQVTANIRRSGTNGISSTSWEGGISGYKVTTCIESINSGGQIVGERKFVSNNTNAQAILPRSTAPYAYNASHTVATSSNVYSPIVTTYTQVR